jgi:rfaE bifunctional protein nucleotidyltransferase chain/domain
MNQKIVDADNLRTIAEAMRSRGEKLVLTNGCFDLLHVGHVRYLRAAQALGNALAVAINGDESVRALKGEGRPINREADRAEVVAGLEFVDYVVVFAGKRATQLLANVRPSIYVKGGDYTRETLNAEERQALEDAGAEIRIVPLETGYSTSSLVEKLRQPDR